MAAVLDALAPYVRKLITDMAEEEVSMLLGVSGEIEKLESNMDSIKDFLADAEKRRITDKSVQGWVRKLKNAMYDATDILDLCQLEAEEKRESKGGSLGEKAPGCLQPLLFCLRNPVFAHKIGSRIKELNQRLEGIRKGAKEFNFSHLGSYPERRMTTNDGHSQTTSVYDESAIVGEKIEKDTKEVVQFLVTNDNQNLMVVSIVGMGGMGKTTLTQKIFKETTIQEHFKTRIWLSITQNFDEIQLLRTAITYTGADHSGEQNMSILTETLTNTLSAGKFLLVMDDVWSEKAWDNVLSAPIMNASLRHPGSRVLITTRSEDLAKRMRVAVHQHHVSPLDEKDAWCLLKRQLSPDKVVGIDALKDVGMKIIKKCGGLPLAIKVMGGLLTMRHPTEREWNDVLNSPAWSVDGLPKELDNRLFTSYEDLFPQLKQCFLYCSLFPKGTKIRMIEIIPMWISEGFIQLQNKRSSIHYDRLDEVGIQYYRELIRRNLIEPVEGYELTGYFCTMHDVVRAFAEFMAREESLVLAEDEKAIDASHNGTHSFVRRLSIGPNKSVQNWEIMQNQVSLRTLLVHCKSSFNPGDSFSCFPCLRLLLLRGADCDELVDSLCELKHLRYLHLEDTSISRLPDDIYRMKLLQHIVIDGSKNLYNLPRCIIQLVNLRSLRMANSEVSAAPKGFGSLKNLRRLEGFPVHMDTDGGWCSLEEIGPLSQLRGLTLHGLENVPASSFAKKAMISSKKHLGYLVLCCSSNKYMGSGDKIEKQEQQRIIEEVFDKLCPPTCIENLIMYGGYFGRRVPNWMMAPATTAFKSLMHLGLYDMPCCTQLPDGLCRLPCLEGLNIRSAPSIKSIGPEFQASSSLAVCGGAAASTSAAFPKLKDLELIGLNEWEEWEWTEQGEDITANVISMPALERLHIKKCKLSFLPSGLGNTKRHALRRLHLYEVANLTVVENFPFVVDLDVFNCPELKRISGLSRLQKIRILRCPNLKVLEGAPALDNMELEDATMKTVPGYMRGVNPRYLELDCSRKLFESLNVLGSSEWDKISHIKTRAIGYLEDSDDDSDEDESECED